MERVKEIVFYLFCRLIFLKLLLYLSQLCICISQAFICCIFLSNHISRESKWQILGVTLLPPYLPRHCIFNCLSFVFVFLKLVFFVDSYQTLYPGTANGWFWGSLCFWHISPDIVFVVVSALYLYFSSLYILWLVIKLYFGSHGQGYFVVAIFAEALWG